MSQPKTLMIDDVEYVRKDSVQVKLPEGDFTPWELGENYHIETCTKYFLGKLVQVTDNELVITNASWVADCGRMNEYLSGKQPSENETFPKDKLVIIQRGAVVSAVKHDLCGDNL
jgi:hypothetical protein